MPVLVGVAERDIIADVKDEPRAYLAAKSVDLFECPRMGHMHNFADTRTLLWKKLISGSTGWRLTVIRLVTNLAPFLLFFTSFVLGHTCHGVYHALHEHADGLYIDFNLIQDRNDSGTCYCH